MSSIRHLEGRLRAWRGFHDIAHAARTLAAAQSLRWAGRVTQSAHHLAWCEALQQAWQVPASDAPRAAVVIAIGTDLGLCGRLNRLVAEALDDRLRRAPAALTLSVGARLRAEFGERPGLGPAFAAPTSFAAVEGLAGRLERLLRQVTPAPALDLSLILASHTLASGTPVIATWTDAPRGLDGASTIRAGMRADALPLTPSERAERPAAALLLHARLVHALCVAAASEASARLQTMSRALETSERRIAEQERHLRKLHQEATTQEMLEVLGGRRSARAAWRRARPGRSSHP
ncbi:MAG: F0F1 ATP synthase subunit gamma [Myxococcales bacterium]|nr:F0F1 ATP synthase subunit gamma [Myxococcales bacterium]MCB9703025.1 F0F1 ATP synthase subunit gamma [Myxococcales bacterium]